MTQQHLEQPVAEPYGTGDDALTPWERAVDELDRAATFWLATAHPTGRPHVVPVLAVVTGGALHFAASPDTQKARNLARDPRATVTTSGGVLDIVLEGTADRIDDDEGLVAAAEAYLGTYGWEVEVRSGSLAGDGAPTAGPPPYHVFRLTPHRAFGFPTTGDAAPTRWRFPATEAG